jgi:hypothetical protein
MTERKAARGYPVRLGQEADGGYVVTLPDIGHGATQGDTLEEALHQAEDPPFLPGVYLVLLTKSPKEIAENDVFLRQLCSSIKVLTDMAAPATVSSIY